MSKLFLLAFFLLIAIELQSQSLSFGENGKLTQINTNTGNKLVDFDIKQLTEADTVAKKAACAVLIEKINEALKIIESNHYKKALHQFHIALWDGTNDSAIVVAYLTELRNALQTQQAPTTPTQLATPFFQAFKKYLATSAPSVYSTKFDSKKPTTLELQQKDPFNLTIIDYYNATLNELTENVDLPINKTAYYIEYLTQRIDSAHLLLQYYREHPTFDTVYFRSVRRFRDDKNHNNATLQHLKNEFRKPWFKQWFWFRGGEIRLNPLNFHSEAFIRNNPSFDLKKARQLNVFIDSLLQRQLRYDSTGRIDEFITKLKLQGAGESVFSLQVRNDSLLKVNAAEQQKLLTTVQILNKIEIPAKGNFFHISAIKEIDLGTAAKALSTSLHIEEEKTIALHNLSGTEKAGLLQSEKDITDRSAFQDGFDTVASQLGQLAKVVSTFTPFAGLLNTFIPTINIPNNVITYDATVNGAMDPNKGKPINNQRLDVGFVTVKYGKDTDGTTLYSTLASALYVKDLLDINLFKEVFAGQESRDLKAFNNKSLENVQEKHKELLNIYLEILQKRQIDSLIKDSVLMAGLIDVFNFSTLPLTDPLKPAKAVPALYHTVILKTDPSNKAVERNILVYSVLKTDTTNISKFSYKVGKWHRFALGAGLAYTLTPYNQSVATASNGSITITNNVRQYRLVVGLHTYFGDGLFTQDNSFWGKNRERNFFFVGVGIPDPLENIYLGFGRDLYPGLKLTVGAHMTKYNKYKIQNDAIIEEKLRYKLAGPFVSLGIDPTSLVNLLNVFKKQ